MRSRTWIAALIVSALVSACGGSGSHGDKPGHKHTPAPAQATVASARPTALPGPARPARPARPPAVQALVTAETENRVLVVDLPSGRVVRRIPVAPDPEDLATDGNGGEIVVVSAAAGKVTLLNGDTLRPLKVLAGFDQPHIAAIAPDGQHAYVTDDARGTVTAIDLANLRVTDTIHVGAGAHHICFDTKDQLAWVALGESARMLVLLGTQDIAHPRVVGHFPPASPVHDLACSPGRGRFWLTSATGPDVTLVDGFDQGVVFRVPVGPPPQHVVLQGRYAYLTSGYGGVIEQVDANTGRILAKAKSPYGSFELAADGRYVVTSSLLRGTLAIYTPQLRLLRVQHLAPATREVALSSPGGSPP
jgi:YVTN family beta-propeller protein